ncbi:hypothetical protein CKO35_04465 [Ectothiorhodospira shaposhnikovii]|uniref:hypothetical protein n=1 Tax=Ectothiorhodospira shaposhnikovii TaxID=1054 RepID=UPI00190304D1|nr:hypothetical protein [Ectothiorhodospira shaposhnikovii]MBK1672563.1 hypothetical protein [Ectothiorhodospira shaposhnikovii]
MARWLSVLLIPVMLGAGYLLGEHWLRPLLVPMDVEAVVIEAPAGCELDAQGCLMMVAGTQVRVWGPDRIPPLAPFDLRLDGAAPMEALDVSYIMPGMEMGVHRFEFTTLATGGWVAESVLPVCMSGRMDWVAKVRIRLQGQPYELRIPVLLRRG